jgi:uncharacterized protein YbjT (DUF2867 family)
MRTAILAGTTGLIGSQVLELLLITDAYDQVIALSRKPLTTSHPKLTNLVLDFDSLEAHAAELRGDDVYCCLGTTLKQAGSKEAFQKVDCTYPVSLARITKNQGARQFLIVTALGADKHSTIFYNRVKGEVEEAVRSIDFEALHIFQPSMLLGPRAEERSGERIGQAVMKALGFLIPRKYKAIDSLKVARAMVTVAGRNLKGIFVHASGDLQSL